MRKFRTHKTRRLLLRPFKEGDFPLWKKTFENEPPPKNKWDRSYRTYKVFTQKEFRKHLTKFDGLWKKDSTYRFGVFDRGGHIVGEASIMQVVRGAFQSAAIGYTLINTYWGKGYGSEVAEALSKIAFTKLKLNRIEAFIEPRNIRSIRVIRKAGFWKEGYVREYARVNGQWRDSTRYALTKSEWQK